MTACAHCGQRKGKRPCPAKGANICSQCCGKHRRREIACPDGCPYLPARSDVGATIDKIQQKVLDFALSESVVSDEAMDLVLGREREMMENPRPGRAADLDRTAAP